MKNKRIASKIIDNALNVLIVFFVLFLFVSMYTAIQVKIFKNDYADFFGYSMFEIQTGSMHGAIEIGDWIITKSTTDVNVGDIVTYRNGKDYITHRIIESYGGTYVTKGDANTSSDDAIDKSQIVGKVVGTLHGFGILKKTIFNPIVILLLIITLYFFNLTFKKTKNKFDIKVQSIIDEIKKYVVDFIKKNKLGDIKPKVEIKEEKKETPLEEENVIKEEIQVAKEEPIIEEIEVLDDETEDEKEEELSKTKLFRVISVKDNKEEEEKKEEELSKTSVYRFISVPEEKEEALEKTEDEKEEELSKTKLFRVISVDQKPLVYEEEEEKEDETSKISIPVLAAEEVDEKIDEKVIDKEYIYGLLKSKKAKDVVDKAFIVKKTIYDEIMDVLLKPNKAYVYKSTMRGSFINYYVNCKYFGTDDDRKKINTLISDYYNELIKKYTRDENKINIVNAYIKSLYFISSIEDKNKVNYEKEIKRLFRYDPEVCKYMAHDIENIVKYSNEFMKEILDELTTKAFEVKYNKFENGKNLFGAILKHNISFNKVYSDYIVDKTYNGGIISEDKIAVLLNIILCRVVFDLMRFDYSPKYFVYLPESLYSKDRKIDKIAAIVDNDYSKSHVYFLTKSSNMLKNKDDMKRLRKRGYSFACLLDEKADYKNDDMGYFYMNDYYFIDSKSNKEELSKGLPKDIVNKIIVDDIKKKVGDYGDE